MMTLPVNAVDTVGTLGNEYNKSNTMIIAETNCPLKYYDNNIGSLVCLLKLITESSG